MKRSIHLALFIILISFLVDIVYHVTGSVFLSILGVAIVLRYYLKG